MALEGSKDCFSGSLDMHFFIYTPSVDFTAQSVFCSRSVFHSGQRSSSCCQLALFFQMAIFALAARRSVNAVMSMAFSIADEMLLFQA